MTAGSTVLTPHGVETLAELDMAMDQYTTLEGHTYAEEALKPNQPPIDATPAERAAWLDAPELIIIDSHVATCSCQCSKAKNGCYYLVTTHGADKQATHQRNTGCTCGEKPTCCAYPL